MTHHSSRSADRRVFRNAIVAARYERLALVFAVPVVPAWWLSPWLAAALALAPAVTVALWINASTARTDLGPDTVRVRTLTGTTTLSIGDVAGLVIRGTALGRHMRLRLRSGATLRMAAPSFAVRNCRIYGQIEAAQGWCRDHGLSFDHEP